ncbi:hypothetical protein [Streptomyces graminilatus]|uniref:hypothetical protein n=1 Tax=Streptomyces graminilatus TaxID=1464070 RepID=UPI0006E226FA|nr:hypothetical protein [Streptomyces graminilatus]
MYHRDDFDAADLASIKTARETQRRWTFTDPCQYPRQYPRQEPWPDAPRTAAGPRRPRSGT